MAKRKKLGFSWSAKKASGLSGARGKVARATGIPTTRDGRRRKMGRVVGCLVPLLICGALGAIGAVVARGADKAPTADRLLDVSTLAPRGKAEADKLVGAKLSGRFVVVNVEPAADGRTIIRAIEKTQLTAGVYARWVKSSWIQVVVEATVDEATGQFVDKGDTIALTGQIASANFDGRRDLLGGTGRGKDRLVSIRLSDAAVKRGG